VKVYGWGGTFREQLKAFFREPERMHGDDFARFERGFEGRTTVLGVPEGSNWRTLPMEQQAAALAAVQKPVWLATDIEIRVAADGTLLGARVLSPSGHRKLDRYALAEVQRVARLEPRPLPRAARLVYRLRAAYVAKIPTSLSLTFDEVLGVLRPDNPVEDVVHEVRLLAFADD